MTVSSYHPEGYCSRGHRQTEKNVVIRNNVPRCRICLASDEKAKARDKQAEERKFSAAMNRENKHGSELVRVSVKGWGCA